MAMNRNLYKKYKYTSRVLNIIFLVSMVCEFIIRDQVFFEYLTFGSLFLSIIMGCAYEIYDTVQQDKLKNSKHDQLQ